MSARPALSPADGPRRFLSMPQVVERYAGVWSKWTLYELVRTGAIPHRKLSGRRELLFVEADLEAWEDGAPLTVKRLRDGGRIVRPAA